MLRAEPTGVYRRQEFATRDRYRQAVEQLAKAAERDEVEVARLAVDRAAAAGSDPRAGHVGYHLVAEGRSAFARELGCRFTLRDRWRGVPHRPPARRLLRRARRSSPPAWSPLAAVLAGAGAVGRGCS